MAYPVSPTVGQTHTEVAGKPRVWDGVAWRLTHNVPPAAPNMLIIGDSLCAYNDDFFTKSIRGAARSRRSTLTLDAVGGRSMTIAVPIIAAMSTVPPVVVLALVTNVEGSDTGGGEIPTFTGSLDANVTALRAKGATEIWLTEGYIDPAQGGFAAAFSANVEAKNVVMRAKADADADVHLSTFARWVKANKEQMDPDDVHHLAPMSYRWGVHLAGLARPA